MSIMPEDRAKAKRAALDDINALPEVQAAKDAIVAAKFAAQRAAKAVERLAKEAQQHSDGEDRERAAWAREMEYEASDVSLAFDRLVRSVGGVFDEL